jgi:trans-2,3-dihydro-3-hydroxyanthranilate isomerase
MPHRFITTDVFTATPFAGNPLAVVLDATGLTDAAMQRIAREFNLSETAFVLPPIEARNTARVRIFTPTRELQFAGHPTIGTAVVLAELAQAGTGPFETEVRLEEGIGLLRVQVACAVGVVTYGEFAAVQLPRRLGNAPPVERLAAALSLSTSDIGGAGHAPCFVEAGVPFLFVPLHTIEALARARVNAAVWPGPQEYGQPMSVFLYTRGGQSPHATYHARMFAPDFGMLEDPATGSAAAALPGQVHAFEPLADGTPTWLLEQGYEMGRPSDLRVSVDVSAGAITAVRVGGQAVQVSEGTLKV